MEILKYRAVILGILCLVFGSCDRYLEIEPKGRQLLKTTNDFDQWLNNVMLTAETPVDNILNYMTDNIDLPNIGNPPSTFAELLYTWAPQFSTDVNTTPNLWGEHYLRINLFNTVLLGIDGAEGGTETQKRSLKAEALLGRAHSYFYLVNEYGKPFDAGTASSDLATPYITSDDVSQTVPPRSTVEQIYQHIIDDIHAAIPDLPSDNTVARFRGSRAAAYSVLARVYLCRREYDEARRFAELALANTRANMIDFTNSATFPTTTNVVSHPDVIYGRSSVALGLTISQNLKDLFASNDARSTLLYYNFASPLRGATMFYALAITPVFQLTNSGTTVQEMHLIAAEGACRSNQLVEALAHLNVVRINRYTGPARTFSSNDRETILNEVLSERRREFPFHGLRWFDMRRLGMEGRMATVTRTNAQDEIIATLEPNSTKYTLQIPFQVMIYNPDMVQNP
ncbi:RagB/SusD family nutrient uptake outer membrane protein [Sphingobacterium griseoflavum]|uniref:Membrane protein n=1 Tax=Sphingobacterium griseoflavum TaxID=1474952 RepID=A0ABQ3I2Z7_9SPHI|nr:RagB/SusD family nutrient uptake outer membrane protein [Sphingobacterium griseoflavum]GHE44706.1 membrane protein [Sphingobacterium griseoflavum]